MKQKKQFKRRLARLLDITGVGRDELARRLGVSVPVVGRWLNGSSAPDVYQFQAIARYFGLPYAWFLEDGDGLPSAAELAVRLGLSEGTVSELMALTAEEYDNTSALEAVDAAIRAVLAVIDGVHEDLCRYADRSVAKMEDKENQK